MEKNFTGRKIVRNVSYNFLYSLFLSGVGFLSLISPKLRLSLKARLKTESEKGRMDYWIHTASSGEFEEAIPLLEKIKEKDPSSSILLTFFSISGKMAIDLEAERRKGASVPWDKVTALPFDFSFTVRLFLKKWHPQKLILLDQEIWPMILLACRENEIPIFLFNFKPPAQVSWIKKTFLNGQLKKINKIGSTGPKPSWMTYPEEKYQIIGNLRTERILQRATRMSVPETKAQRVKPVMILASLWEEDWEMLLPAVKKFIGDFHFIFVPHEPQGSLTSTIKVFLNSIKAPFAEWSSSQKNFSDHLLVNTVGVLFDLYPSAKTAFIGGSFKGKVHNVMEPSAFGLLLITGPYIDNSLEAQKLKTQGGLWIAQNANELIGLLERIKEQPEVSLEKGLLNKKILVSETPSERYFEFLSAK